MGTFGSSITINSPDYSKGLNPVVYFDTNYFEENMAYFSGNAIHIRATKGSEAEYCGGIYMNADYYYRHASPKIHNGGAATFVCKTVDNTHPDYNPTIYPTQNINYAVNLYNFLLLSTQDSVTFQDVTEIRLNGIKVEDSNSGQRGMALSIRNFSKVNLVNNTI
jgi:hypothetical protein